MAHPSHSQFFIKFVRLRKGLECLFSPILWQVLLHHWLLTKAAISFLAIEKVGFSYVYLTLSFLAMDVCASLGSPASLLSFFRSSVLTQATQQVVITSFLGSTSFAQLCDGRVCLQVNACLVRELVWKFSCLEVLFRRLDSLTYTSLCRSLRWTCVPP